MRGGGAAGGAGLAVYIDDGSIAVTWAMDTTGKSLTQLGRKYGRETSHPAARTA